MPSTIPTSLLDHTFGDLDDPARGAAYQLKRSQGIHHFGHKNPLRPKPNVAVTLEATTSSDLPAQEVILRFTHDEWHTFQEIPFNKADLVWDTLSWRWIQHWQTTLPAQPQDTLLRYQVFARLPMRSTEADQFAQRFADNQAEEPKQATQFAIWYGADEIPAWSQSARIYQIFVDRFNPGEGHAWMQTSDLTKPCGGTLRGVIEKLEYILGLGFNVIWLSPIFASPSHHGYDISDYERIEPRLGRQADFEELIAKAHALGLRVILDFVANHVSNAHPSFQDALHNSSSPYHDWFYWQPWPHYRSYFNVPTMPELRLTYGAPARTYLLNCAQKWLRLGADGYRLDFASGPEQDFWVDFRHACREVNPECWLFGEVTLPADAQLSFAGSLDGTLDFLTCQALRETFALQRWPLSRLAGYLQDSLAYFPQDFSRPDFLDNHDMNRFLFTAGGDISRLKIALTLLYALPGQPLVYFGTESALSQPRSIHDPKAIGFDEARLPMNWEELKAHADLADLLRQLAELRQRYPQLSKAEWKNILVDDQHNLAVWQLSLPELKFYLAINRAEVEQMLPLPFELNQSNIQLIDCLNEANLPIENGKLLLKAESAIIFRISNQS